MPYHPRFQDSGADLRAVRTLPWRKFRPRQRPSPASLRSAPSPAVRERGHDAFDLKLLFRDPGEGLQRIQLKLLSRTAGEGGPSPKGLVGEGFRRQSELASWGGPILLY
jgi:hypothetical protein